MSHTIKNLREVNDLAPDSGFGRWARTLAELPDRRGEGDR